MDTKDLTSRLTQNGTIDVHYEWDHGFSCGDGIIECTDITGLIPMCVEAAIYWYHKDCNWHITAISGYLGDVDKLQEQIDKAVDDAWHRQLKIDRRKQKHAELAQLQHWLLNIDSIIDVKKQECEILKKEVLHITLETIQEVFEESNLRVVDMTYTQHFGDTIVSLRIHLNDLRFSEVSNDQLVEKLKEQGVLCLIEDSTRDINGVKIKLLQPQQ